MVLAKNQTPRSMEQNREPRNKPTPIQLINLQQKAKIYSGKKTTSSINGVQKTGQLHAKELNWTTLTLYIQINSNSSRFKT